MNIYEPGIESRADGQDAYMVLLTADRNRLLVPEQCSSSKLVSLETWVPLPVMRNYSVKGNMTKPLADRVGIDAYRDPMVLSRRALGVLTPHIGDLGQTLPLAFEEAEYWFFNVTNVVDALDEAHTDVWRLPSGKFGKVERYAFKPEAVRDQWIFKIPQQRGGFVFVTDRFVDLVRSSGLTGFQFKLKWSDEAPASEKAA
jgi:hypothetical protein